MPSSPTDTSAPDKEEREFFPVATVEWREIPNQPGLSERILAGDAATANHSRMLRFAPGTTTRDTLTHEYWEEVYILEGAIFDRRLEQLFTAGMFACRPPGMPHGPWDSPDGCVTVEVRYEGRGAE